MQATLFKTKVLAQMKVKAPAKVWNGNDVFPYGAWKGQKLSTVATHNMPLLEHWAEKNKIQFTKEFRQQIAFLKFQNK